MRSGATGKAKRGHGNVNEGVLSTAGDEANHGMSTRLHSLLSNNHGNSNHQGSTYLTSVDGQDNKGGLPNGSHSVGQAPSITQLH